MASPLSIFRKYQYILLVVFGVMLMIAFVIAPPILDYQRTRNSGGPKNGVVVSWEGGSLRENDLHSLVLSRNLARVFIDAVVQRTMSENGYPRVPRILGGGGEEEAIRTTLLAQQADEMGMRVSEDAIIDYLEQLSAELIPRGEIGVIFQKTLGDRMNESQLFAIIRRELLAQNYMIMMHPGIFLNRGESVPPFTAWDYHRRLNRRVRAELMPLEVAKYKDKLDKEPTEEQIQALYEKAKDRFPIPESPEPGFKRRRKIAFQYVRADFNTFVQEELEVARESVTDADIEEFYESNKERYREIDLPADETTDTPPEETTSDEATDTPASEGSTEPKKSPADEKGAGPDKPSTKPTAETDTPDPPQDSETTSESSAGAKPAPQKPAADVPPEGAETPAAKEPPAEEPPAPASKPETEEPPAAQDPQSRNADAPPEEIFVSWLQDESPEAASNEKPTEEKPAEEKPAEEKPAEEKPAEEKPAEEKPAEEKPAEEKPAEEKPAEDAPVVEKPVEDATEPATTEAPEDEVAAEKPATDAAMTEQPETSNEEEAPRYKPLDDKLRAEILEDVALSRARRTAQGNLDKALSEIRRDVEKHAKLIKRTETPEEVPPLDIEEAAGERTLTVGSTPLVDTIGVQEYELGRSFEQVEFSWPPQRQEFTTIAFQDDIPPYRPAQIRGESRDIYFLYWRTRQEESFVPELDEIRDEVVDHWKQREALQLAIDDAQGLVKQAGGTGKPLRDLFPEDSGRTVTETNQFSWMSRGFTPAGFGAPGLSFVEGVEGVSNEFMQAVFALKPGELGFGVNQPKTFVYVIRVVEESPSDALLREQFIQSGRSPEIQQIAATEGQAHVVAWYEDLEKELNVQWHRDPQM